MSEASISTIILSMISVRLLTYLT